MSLKTNDTQLSIENLATGGITLKSPTDKNDLRDLMFCAMCMDKDFRNALLDVADFFRVSEKQLIEDGMLKD